MLSSDLNILEHSTMTKMQDILYKMTRITGEWQQTMIIDNDDRQYDKQWQQTMLTERHL